MKYSGLPIQFYKNQELALIYGLSVRKLRSLLKPLEPKTGPRMGHYYTPKQVGIIVPHLNKYHTPDLKLAEELVDKRMIALGYK